MSQNRRTYFSLLAKIGALLVAIVIPASLLAQETPKRELTDKVSESLQPIGVKIVGQPGQPPDYDGAIHDINALLAQVKPESFDTAYLSQMKAQAYIGKQDYSSSVPSLETAYRLSRAYGFFDKTQELGLLWMLAQLYVQDASLEKNTELQKQKYVKALATVRDWLSQTPKPTFEAYLYAASILFQQAIAGKEPDKDLLKQAAVECENALTTSLKPREGVYQLLVAIAQSGNDHESAAKYLELMVEANPKSSQYWLSLLNSYLAAAEGFPEGSFLRNDAYAKAVYTIERAQKQGFMVGPQDYYRLFACYFNSSQYEGAVDVLESGLQGGKIEGDQKNWELLSSCYLQLNRTQKAIDTLERASKIFNKTGDIDMQIGYLYYGDEQYRKALDYMKIARDKGVVENRKASLLFFIGYLHFELKELDEALETVNKSLEIDPKNDNARRVQTAIIDAINERDRNLKKNKPAETQENKGKSEQPAAQQVAPAQPSS